MLIEHGSNTNLHMKISGTTQDLKGHPSALSQLTTEGFDAAKVKSEYQKYQKQKKNNICDSYVSINQINHNRSRKKYKHSRLHTNLNNKYMHKISEKGNNQMERRCLVTRSTDDGQDVEEDIDNVKVEVESRKDVLFWRDGILVSSTDHHLRVKHQVLQWVNYTQLQMLVQILK